MASRSWILLAAAVVVAAVCVRLGVWQLARLEERKGRNATIAAAFREPPVAAQTVMRDSRVRFRRVAVRGRWEYANESTIPGRTRGGSPGVHVVTPVTLADGSRILVNRGWVYSPDARTIDLSRWHEGAEADFVGYVDELPTSLPQSTTGSLYVVALGDSSVAQTAAAERPARLGVPAFTDEGPHLNYAVQWFSFAAIALIGTPLVVRRQRRRRD
ncbi:MAG TPA: SURF1 family protein [Gemmatimonadaceae bacterium]|nr:SURF1 family protein [Gemmatimonadaceae bacterium]